MLKALRNQAERQAIVDRLYDSISDRARNPVFFADLGVADTIDGRFDVLVLHVWLVMDELQTRRDTEMSQRLVDTLFVHFDEAMRELGAGDVGMSRRMKKMASAFFGRLEAYRSARDGEPLARAIVRNIYRGEGDGIEAARRIATYCSAARGDLARSALETGVVDFGPLPVTI
ncbi:MAG: ubiquinol-cytochrome C chaperone family protein [Rhizomicrobium sp.]|jgi:cytochrome b pre-mRNA-processing protein 3